MLIICNCSIQERVGVSIPCFLKHFLIPLIRAGQQLQVIMKLLELCDCVFPGDHTYMDFLPCWSGFSSNHPLYTSPMTFGKENIKTMVIARNSYYEKMQEKLEGLLSKLEISYQQVPHFCISIFLLLSLSLFPLYLIVVNHVIALSYSLSFSSLIMFATCVTDWLLSGYTS